MLQNHDVICISSIDWDFIWQGHQEIMSVLAKNGNRVLFIENTGVRAPTIRDVPRLWKRFLNWKKGYRGIRKEKENLYIYSPLTLPFPHSPLAIKINKLIMLSVIKEWMNAMEFRNPVVWSFLPTGIVLDMLNELDPSIFIYYCIDDFVSSSTGARRIRKIEDKVIKRADLVFTTSHKLYDRCEIINNQTHLFPFGVSIDNYNRIREHPTSVPKDMADIKRPIIGYVGGLHKWVDTELLKKIALRRNDLSIVLIGPKQADLAGIDKIDNIFTLGKKDGHELPNYVKFFDIGIIPYKITPYTENVYPTKINEYLAMGKPVISTKIPEVIEFDKENGGNFINFIEDDTDIDRVIDKALNEKMDNFKNNRIRVANKNSWTVKIEVMCDLIEKKIVEIKNQANKDWLIRFRRFYVKSRERAIKIIGAIFFVYLIIFHTPTIWFLASPLKIVDGPEASDAIVAFGGGVGEGGRPGISTIERARYSAELYRGGYAKNIIFSSGYTYNYNDADNMMLLAVSMGVPKNQILLERTANSTYENVKFTTDILKTKGWTKVILVTSPYNAKRAQLVFKKLVGKDIRVLSCPVKEPQFYYRYRVLRLDQLEAIIHEYLGILYYLYKRYI